MFEGSKPIPAAYDAPFLAESESGEALVGSADAGPQENGPHGNSQPGEALRMMEWSELSARLTASRDLRELLRRDAARNIETGTSSFADAAARYFRTRGEGGDSSGDNCEPGVNPVALERCKGSPSIVQIEIRDEAEIDMKSIRRLQDEEADDPEPTATGQNKSPVIGDARED